MFKGFRRSAIFTVVVSASWLLSACTVTVPVIDSEKALQLNQERISRVRAEQKTVPGSMDLQDAIARALLYNLDYRAALMSEAMAQEDLSRSSYALWPQLAAGAGYSARNSYLLSVSKDPNTGQQTLQPSTSSDKKGSTAQLQLTWNALDFGLSYLRAKQKGNAALMAEEQRRKAFQNIVQEVTAAWWRALAAQRMEPRLRELRERVESALERSRKLEEMRLQGQFVALDYRRDLLLSLKRLSALEEEVLNARNDLVRLTALTPGQEFVLADNNASPDPAWLPGLTREQMRLIALANRPELRELNYRQRVAALEGKVAVASLLPSLSLSTGGRYDSNSYLINNEWMDMNAQFSFNLMGLAALPSTLRYKKSMESAESLRADAMTVAVLSQLDVALRAIQSDRSGWCISRELERVASEKERQYKARSSSLSGDELSQIRSEVESVLAGLESAFSRAELEASQAMLLSSLGVDPYPENLERSGPIEVATQMRTYFSKDLRSRLLNDSAALAAAPAGDGAISEPALKSFEDVCKI
ncbi:MAG: TolC family protein [Pedobacter sp.]|nr:TolC family protein [Pedobacter sp.]